LLPFLSDLAIVPPVPVRAAMSRLVVVEQLRGARPHQTSVG
jgi:hypothetical protein